MVVNKLGVDVLLLILCRLRFCKSFQSDNYVYYDLNNSALDFLSFISGQGPRLDFNNGPGDNSNSCRILAPGLYSSPIQIISSNTDQDYHSLCCRDPFHFPIFPPKCYEVSFKRAQSVNKNCLTTPHLFCYVPI